VKLLRSWLKQERMTSRHSSWGATLRIAILLLLATLSLEGLRRVSNSAAQQLQRQNEQLELLSWIALDTNRPLLDWAHWDDIYNFVTGKDPDFVTRYMETTGLLDGGAVLAIVDSRDQLTAISGADSHDRSPRSALVQCLTGVAAMQRRRGEDYLPVICPSEHGPLAGGIATITDNLIRRTTTSRLIYLVPLLESGNASSVQQGLSTLSKQLVLSDTSPGQAGRAQRVVTPTLWTGNEQKLSVQDPDSSTTLARELLPLALLALCGVLMILGLRAQWMLAQRRLQLERLHSERMSSQRIRRTERELTELLDQVQLGNDANESMAFARMLKRRVDVPLTNRSGTQRVERLAERFEGVLQTARSLALLDVTTGLPNRSYFLERLNWESERSRNRGVSLALLFINIDKFKQINETYGHSTGDGVLQHVAQELEKLIESNDFLARFGGDEFSLILNTENLDDPSEETLREHSHQRALDLLERFQNKARRLPDQISLSLSIGIAISDAAGTTPEELIRRSDMAMVLAKTHRQRRVSVFDIKSDWDELNNYRLFNALQSDISHAPERFSIVFQSIVDASERMCKVEALSRWANPEFPDVPADLIFSLAERYRLVPELGQLILERTLQELVQLRQELNRPDLNLAINISPSQLSQQDFSIWLLAQLSLQRIRPESVTVEVTESAVVETSQELTDNLDALRRAGVKLALDDFGTGFSSLRLLMWLKPDELKIDKSFVLAASHDPVALKIVQLLQTLTAQMQLLLVAEGVEDAALLQLLLQAGVQRFQGFLFARPLSRSDFVANYRDRTSQISVVPA
jgi:diguanylate cyclase (GGDEF)-like protein